MSQEKKTRNYKELMVYVADENKLQAGKELAIHLGIEYTENIQVAKECGLWLQYDSNGLSLADSENTMHGDFTKLLKRVKKSNLQREVLVKAARIKGADHRISVLDATAGMGEDSLLLAAAGFSVKLYEYNPVIAALLRDALERARDHEELGEIVERMEFVEGDSLKAMSELSEVPDVILLDPMFPARKKSALVKKKFQLLQQLECPCSEEVDLLQTAMDVKPRKIVIKRPAKGPHLAGKKPDYSLEGKAIRYDCFVFAR